MLKFAALAVIICVTSFAGFYFSSALKNRLVCLKKINFLIDEIAVLLRFRSATVYEITECLRENERFTDFAFLHDVFQQDGISFQQSWCNAVEGNPPASLKRCDIELLEDIGRQLGTSDIDGQMSMLGLQQAEVSSLISSAEADCLQKSKLYRSLGVLSGAFISIMML